MIKIKNFVIEFNVINIFARCFFFVSEDVALKAFQLFFLSFISFLMDLENNELNEIRCFILCDKSLNCFSIKYILLLNKRNLFIIAIDNFLLYILNIFIYQRSFAFLEINIKRIDCIFLIYFLNVLPIKCLDNFQCFKTIFKRKLTTIILV